MEQENAFESEDTVIETADSDQLFIRQARACLGAGIAALAMEIVPAILLIPIHHTIAPRQQQLFAFIDGPALPLILLAIFVSACTSIIVGHLARDRQSAPRGLISAGLSFAYIALAVLILFLGWNLLRHHL